MMSTPSTISRLREDASASWGSTTAGRRLANALSADRMASRPPSGRLADGRWSHLYLEGVWEGGWAAWERGVGAASPCQAPGRARRPPPPPPPLPQPSSHPHSRPHPRLTTAHSHAPANGRQQHGLPPAAGGQGLGREWVAGRVNRSAPDQGLLKLELHALSLTSGSQDVDGDGRNFGSDAVAGQHGDAARGGGRHTTAPRCGAPAGGDASQRGPRGGRTSDGGHGGCRGGAGVGWRVWWHLAACGRLAHRRPPSESSLQAAAAGCQSMVNTHWSYQV